MAVLSAGKALGGVGTSNYGKIQTSVSTGGDYSPSSRLAEAEQARARVVASADRIAELTEEEKKTEAELRQRMLIIPNIIDPSVPIGPDDSCTASHAPSPTRL